MDQAVDGSGQYQRAFLAVKGERKRRGMDQSSSSSDSSLDNSFLLPLSWGQQRYFGILKIKGIYPWTPGINATKGINVLPSHICHGNSYNTDLVGQNISLSGQMWNRSSRRNQSYFWDMSDTGTTREIAPQDPKLCQSELWRHFLKFRDKTWAQEPRLCGNPFLWEIFSRLEGIKQGSAEAWQSFSISKGC